MNFVRLAVRVAEQSQTALPIQHDVALPLFEDEAQEAVLEKLSESAQALVDGVQAYLESIGDDMESSGHIMPGELENVEQLRHDHTLTICQQLIDKALGGEDEEQGGGGDMEGDLDLDGPPPPAEEPAPEEPAGEQ